MPKAKEEGILDEAVRELIALAGDLDDEECAIWEDSEAGEDEDEIEDDNVDGWVDEVGRMSETEREELDKDTQPVRRVLVKVCILFPHFLCSYG